MRVLKIVGLVVLVLIAAPVFYQALAKLMLVITAVTSGDSYNIGYTIGNLTVFVMILAASIFGIVKLSGIKGEKRPFAKHAALWSVLIPIVVLLAAGNAKTDVPGRRNISLILASFYIAGLLLAVIALAGIRKHGKKGIFGFGLTGLIVNTLFIVGFVSLLPVMARIKMASTPYTAAELQAMPQVIAGSTKIINEEFGFRFEIPSGFEKYSDDDPAAKNVLYSYMKRNEDGSAIVIQIAQLDGIIGPEKFDDVEAVRRSQPANAKVVHQDAAWKQYRLDVFAVEYPLANKEIMYLAAHVPLVKRAIELRVFGTTDKEIEVNQLFKQVLASLTGKSNWDFNPAAIKLRTK